MSRLNNAHNLLIAAADLVLAEATDYMPNSDAREELVALYNQIRDAEIRAATMVLADEDWTRYQARNKFHHSC